MTVKAPARVASAAARATAKVPVAKRSSSNSPIGPFQKKARDETMVSAKSRRVSGPMSIAAAEAGIASTGTASGAAVESDGSAVTMTSRGRQSRSPARARIEAASSNASSSTRERPVSRPWARRKVFAIAPPTRIRSARSRNASSNSILSEILAPPKPTTNGRGGSDRKAPSASISRSTRRPATAGRSRVGTPTVDAWARWSEPKASLTK